MSDDAWTLLQVTVPAVITGVLLLWQQWRTNAREAEKEASAAAAKVEDRRFSLQERWRDDRRQVHGAMLSNLDTAFWSVTRVIDFTEFGPAFQLEVARADAEYNAVYNAARKSSGEVSILGSEEARAALQRCLALLPRIRSTASSLEDPEPRLHRREELIEEFRAANGAYLIAVRAELGTAEE